MNKNRLFLVLLAILSIFNAKAGEIIEESNKYGGKTELLIPHDTSVREYLKNFYDDTGFLVVQEEKMGPKSLVEVPYFLNRTYYTKKNPSIILIEHYVNPIAYEAMNQRYKDTYCFKEGKIVISYEYYFNNSEYNFEHIIQRKYQADGSFDEKIIKMEK